MCSTAQSRQYAAQTLHRDAAVHRVAWRLGYLQQANKKSDGSGFLPRIKDFDQEATTAELEVQLKPQRSLHNG